ncbi:HK97 gp10 family phage protein [Campylobacter concisus]|uniref:HK97 gp10 family phage protein n=1 Tax=Campylobacter concisus TaxID=199 RepID=UPI0018A96367|nr:HK97 gp10 family phage protein [Campylobacter concisus]QPI03692.1 HK97 gp10 family phage protein [Campylobacter concisus]
MIDRQIDNFSAKAQEKVLKIFKKSVIDLTSDIISDTPVDTGRLKNNWFPSVGVVSTEATEATANEAGDRANSFVSNQLALDKTFYFTNNLPYAFRIEFEGWSKNKAPQGMVRRNAIRWKQIVKRAARA